MDSRGWPRFGACGSAGGSAEDTRDEVSGVRPCMPRRPERVGPYRVLGVLGEGGMGVVYLAERGTTRVAVKCLRTAPGAGARRRFEAEAFVQSALSHPNVVRVLDGDTGPEPYLVLELVEGPSLLALCSALGARGLRLPIDACLYVAERAARALAHAHALEDEHGRSLEIVHRDVSPSNLLLTREGSVKLTDFGLVRHRDRDWATTAGLALGKIGYMPPELLRGGEVDARADVYALGVVLWECLTGRVLVPRRSLFEAAERVVQGQHPAPSTWRPRVPTEVDALVARAISIDPDARPSAAGLASALCLARRGRGRRTLERAVRGEGGAAC
ncbi:serine/threonine protein kinase [Sandaracinus amylolyticus]|uniref:Serine/threonine protein kinase n=2 Tax=Sandaracinus amylolyticus TaxID=927083 RepID=A0A0F6SEH0_9BACT|nr:serine/threonine protein kinase [Sandaracinus amylolyticus]